MIVLIKLFEKNDEYYLYHYGMDENNLDGIIKIYLKKGTEGEIVKESSEKNRKVTLTAICKLMKARDNDSLSESIFYDEYGSKLFEYLGKPYSQENKALIEAECMEVLRKTEGIADVESVAFEWVDVNGEKKLSLRAKYCYVGSSNNVETVFKFAV